MTAPSDELSRTSDQPEAGELIRCAFCSASLAPTAAQRFRAELLCKECAAVAGASQRAPGPVLTVAERAAAIDTAAIATNRLALSAVLSIVGVGAVVIGAFLVGHFTKDTWELDNASTIRTLADEARRLEPGDARAALAKYAALTDLVGTREIREAELKQTVESARDRRRSLESRFAAEIAREREEALRRDQAEQERQQRVAREEQRRREEAAREEQKRREETERRAAAERLKLDAYLMSQQFVKERLKAPSSARFPEYERSDVVVSFDEQTRKYTVIAWVEAQNPFGVHLRSTYMCRLWPAGGDLWRSDLTNISNP